MLMKKNNENEIFPAMCYDVVERWKTYEKYVTKNFVQVDILRRLIARTICERIAKQFYDEF